MNNILGFLITSFVLVLVMSYAFGHIVGGHAKASKVISWELKWLKKMGRWTLKRTLKAISDVCLWGHGKL
jgi:hypothetical protein